MTGGVLQSRWLIMALAVWASAGCEDRSVPIPPAEPIKRPERPPGADELVRAVRTGNMETVRNLLARGADPNALDGDGRAALHAFFSGQNWQLEPELLDMLLQRGADPNLPDTQGRTPMHCAAERGRVEMVGRLLRVGARIDRADEHGKTPLHLVGERKDWLMASALLAAGADPMQQDDWGQQPVSWLAPLCVRDLRLRFHAKDPPRAPACTRHSKLIGPALHLAAADGAADVVGYLLERGVDPQGRFGFLPDLGIPGTALHAAAASGRTTVVRLLLDRGVGPDVVDANGWTPLHHAVWKGHTAVVEILLQGGANPAARTRGGETALDLARHRAKPDLLEILSKLRRTP